MKIDAKIALVLAGLLVGGCPGGLETAAGGGGGGGNYTPPGTYDLGLSNPLAPLSPDAGVADSATPLPVNQQVAADAGAQTGLRLDALAADTGGGSIEPDPLPNDPKTSGGGQACPCNEPFVCINGACRKKCQPGGVCSADAAECGTAEACLNTGQGFGLCLPAAAPGAACGTDKPGVYCPKGHMCASYNGGPYKCMATCATPNAACGFSGKCMQVQANCNFCTGL